MVDTPHAEGARRGLCRPGFDSGQDATLGRRCRRASRPPVSLFPKMREMTDIQKLTRAWIDFQRTRGADLEWSSDEFIELANQTPEVAWECILGVIEAECRDDILANLAEGPLEDLLAEHGSRFIDRIENMSRENIVFARLVKHVWVEAIPAQLQNRVRVIQSKYGNHA